MLAVAAMVQVTLYFTQYFIAVTEDGWSGPRVHWIPALLNCTLITHYSLVLHGGLCAVLEFVVFGYVVAILQFLTLMAGGKKISRIGKNHGNCFAPSFEMFILSYWNEQVSSKNFRKNLTIKIKWLCQTKS
jgi:hypothetical protein